MRRVIKVLSLQNDPLGWVEVGQDIFAFSQNLSAGETFPTVEEAIKFVQGSYEKVQVREVSTHRENNS